MKLKYRKLTLIISMSAMGVGLITFSIAGKKEKTKEVVESAQFFEAGITQEPTVIPTEEPITPSVEPTDTPAPTEQVTDTPTPTEEASVLEVDAYPEINELIKDYLQAKLDGKEKKIKKLVTDPSSIDIDMIQKKTEFIESYDDIKVYTKEGNGDVDMIAYVSMKLKIASIDTKAPGLNEFYLKKADDGYKIISGEISDETAAYIDEARKSDEVQELLEKVNKKFDKAIKSDGDLEEFAKKLGAEE